MGKSHDDRLLPSKLLKNEDDTAVGGPNDDSAHVEVDEDTAWATAEGYTPLTEMAATGTAAFVSLGPSVEDAPAFFADLSTFAPTTCAEEDEDVEEEDETVNHVQHDAAMEIPVNADYRNVADQALFALEEDYRRTLEADKSILEEIKQPAKLASNPLFVQEEQSAEQQFVADFDKPSEELPSATTAEPKQLPDIDTDAVKRAVSAISLKDPNLQTNLQDWEIRQKETVKAPRRHALIPSQPLLAFSKTTTKAIQATANLSRSACIAECLERLDLLKSQNVLCIHIVGCNHVECSDGVRTQTLLGPLVRWIGAAAESPKQIVLHLIGPDVVVAQEPINLLPQTLPPRSRLEQAQAIFHATVYDELEENNKADLVIAFNAGIWGYNDWRPTIRHLADRRQSIPFVITAYTLQEAEDDYDVILEEVSANNGSDKAKEACIWEPEGNPFASKQPRETATAVQGRTYRENAAWQAWRL